MNTNFEPFDAFDCELKSSVTGDASRDDSNIGRGGITLNTSKLKLPTLSQQGTGGGSVGHFLDSGTPTGGSTPTLGGGFNLGGGNIGLGGSGSTGATTEQLDSRSPNRPMPEAPDGFYGGGGGGGFGGGMTMDEDVSGDGMERTAEFDPIIAKRKKQTDMFMWALLIGSVGYLAYGIYKKKIQI